MNDPQGKYTPQQINFTILRFDEINENASNNYEK